jgi:hypothetical protein
VEAPISENDGHDMSLETEHATPDAAEAVRRLLGGADASDG